MSESRTMGDVLRAARRKRRVSIERAAEETRIRADFLMRMESDEFDFLAPAYVRGFLRNYCRFLGVPPEPMVQEFDRRYGSGRTDTGQIAALERRGRNVPRERHRLGGWTMAATLAACVLAALAWIGLNQTPPPLRPGTTAGQEGAAHERDVASSTPSPTPSRTPRPQRREALALASGMRVEIVAVRAPCWVSVQADGVDVYTSPGPGLQVGQRAGPFSASDSMDIVLGNPYGVDLVINGARFGPMGRSGDPDTISLPEDAKSLL